MRTKHLNLAWLAGAFALIPSLGSAFTFEPTDAEFLAWPKYCQVVYVRTQIGSRSRFVKLVTPADEVAARSVLGDKEYGAVGLHHYCAGMALLDRARSESDPRLKHNHLLSAEANADYTLGMSSSGHPMFPAAATLMANIKFEQGELAQAMDLLDAAIAFDPKNPTPYVSKAAIHHRRGEFEAARAILEKGDANVGGSSPDIQYNLGLILVKLGEPGLAEQYAVKAYERGYPLPGLRAQLQRLGHWTAANN